MENIGTFPQKSFDFKKFIFKVIAHWYLFVISLSVAYIYAYLKNRYEIPVYSVHSTVIVKEEESPENIVGGLRIYKNRQGLDNELAILKSYQLNEKAINELDFRISYFQDGRLKDSELYTSSPFFVLLDSAHYQKNGSKILVKLLSDTKYRIEIEDEEIEQELNVGEYFKSNNYCFTVVLNDKIPYYPYYADNQYYFVINSLDQLIRSYMGRLNIRAYTQSSSVLWLWINGTVPQKKADYLNKLIEVYILWALDEKNRIAINTIKFIDKRLEIVIDSLQKAEEKLQQFKFQNKIINLSSEGEALFEQLSELQNQKNQVDVNHQYYDYVLREIKNENISNIMPPAVMGIEDPLLEGQIETINEYLNEKNVKSYKIIEKEDIPSLDLIDINIRNAFDAMKKSIANNKKASELVLIEINKKISVINKEIQKLPATERQMLNITRKFNLNDKQYTFLLQRRTEAGITLASNEPDIKTLDKANPANASMVSPNTGGTRNNALIVGFLIPLAYIVIRDFFNNRITDKNDIQNLTQMPIIGTVPNNKSECSIPVTDNPKSAISESFRVLRTNLQYLLIDKPYKSIAVSSTISSEGKTFCSMNIASIIALSDKKVLLVGLDLRKPSIHRAFKISNQKGISSYLIKEHTVEDIIIPTHINNLYIAPSGPIPPNPAELIESERMKEFFNTVKEKFDFVVIDTPPIAIVTDALLISKFASLNIFIIRQNYSRQNMIKYINELYSSKRIENAGILLNDMKVIREYKYGYSSGIEYMFRYKYGNGYYTEEQKPKNKRNC